MKVAFIIVLLALGHTNAKEFFANLANTFSGIGKAVAETGKALAEAGKQQLTDLGKNLLGQGTNLVGSALASLVKNTLFGRRDISDVINEGDNILKGGETFVHKLLTDIETVTHHGLDHVAELGGQLLHKPLDAIHNEIDTSVATHQSVLDHLLHSIPDEFQKYIGGLIKTKKRSISDTLLNIGQHLFSTVRPFVQSAKQTIGTLGTSIKNTASVFAGTVIDHLTSLGSKLAGHAADITSHATQIVHHGTQVLKAVEGLVSDKLDHVQREAIVELSGIADEDLGNVRDTVYLVFDNHWKEL